MNSGFVSIVGRPNVGKSTLINRLVGEKIAAVSPRPQTTRNRIMGVCTSQNGQIVFVDTPGIHKPYSKMHQKMVHIALASLQGIDAVLLMVDCSQEFGKGDTFVLDEIKKTESPVVLALNKVDKIQKTDLLPIIDLYAGKFNFKAIIPISALKGDGINRLETEIFQLLPEAAPVFSDDVLTDQSEQAFAAEIIREKVFLNTRKEIPFSSAVFVEGFEEENDILNIAATILVERSSQKGIVIGKGGQMLKRIGTEARHELEKIFNIHIYLELYVKVRENWRENERILREMGLD